MRINIASLKNFSELWSLENTYKNIFFSILRAVIISNWLNVEYQVSFVRNVPTQQISSSFRSYLLTYLPTT